MSLCADGKHAWDAQVALRKGGVEVGDPCDCGLISFTGLRSGARLPLGLNEATPAAEIARLRASVETERSVKHRELTLLEETITKLEAEMVHPSVLADFAAALLDVLDEWGAMIPPSLKAIFPDDPTARRILDPVGHSEAVKRHRDVIAHARRIWRERGRP